MDQTTFKRQFSLCHYRGANYRLLYLQLCVSQRLCVHFKCGQVTFFLQIQNVCNLNILTTTALLATPCTFKVVYVFFFPYFPNLAMSLLLFDAAVLQYKIYTFEQLTLICSVCPVIFQSNRGSNCLPMLACFKRRQILASRSSFWWSAREKKARHSFKCQNRNSLC